MEQLVRLGDVCTVVSGSTPKTSVDEYWNGDVKWITPAELDADSYYIHDSVKHITELGRTKTGLSYMPVGTVILSSRAPIGKTAILGCEMCCNQGFKNLICTDRIFNEYLYHFLRAKTNYLNSLGRGATFKELSKGIVENVLIPLPAIEEQHHIADLFASVEELIQTKKQQLDLFDELVKSRFIELFGDPETNPKGLEKVLLSDIAEYFNGLTYSPDNVTNDGTIVLRSSNIQNSQLDFADTVRVNSSIKDKLFVKDNDILMCSRNGSARLVGKVALIKNLSEPMTFGAFMMIIRSRYYPYLMTYFQMDAFRRQIATGATTTINQITGNMLNKISLPLPNMADINEFATFVEQTDKSKSAVQQSIAELEELKKSLMQKYFG